MSKISLHWRKDSGELEVFEAANYFAVGDDHHVSFSHKIIREGCNNQPPSCGRLSLDMPIVPIRRPSTLTPQNYKPQLKQAGTSSLLPSQIMENNSVLKQPRSPGARLGSCLNILFNQTVSSKKKKKKKKKKLMISAMKDNEDAHSLASGRISEQLNGRTSSSYTTARNTTTSTTYGFITTLSSSYPYNPRNSCKDNHRLPKNESAISKISVHHWADKILSEENEHTKLDDDGGGNSDTSSDLFDLPNNELLDCSSAVLPNDEYHHNQEW